MPEMTAEIRKEIRNLNPKEQWVIAWIHGYIAQNGYPPTTREIAREIDQSQCVVCNILSKLQSKNLLTWIPNQARSIKLWFQFRDA